MISLRAHLKRIAPLGGKARAHFLSKKQRTAHAKKMVRAREAKKLTKSIPPN